VKRSGITRKTWLARGTTPLRRSPVRKRNPVRQASAFTRSYHSLRRKRWIAAHPCLVCGTLPSVNAHTKHPSAGASRKGDFCAIVPLCDPHEREKHRHGEHTFNAKYTRELGGHTLAAHAARIDAEWQRVSSEVAA
jgi:hypothetical protein